MMAFVWALVAIGVLFILGSFFVSEKLSHSDLNKIREVSEHEVKAILEDELGKADGRIRDAIDEQTSLAIDKAESEIGKQTTETLLGISEYSDTVLESMNKSHSEIMFMYDALSGKQEALTNLTKDVQLLESAVTLDKKELIEKAGRLDEVMALLEEEKNALAIQKQQLEDRLKESLNNVLGDEQHESYSDGITEKKSEVSSDSLDDIASGINIADDEKKIEELPTSSKPESLLPPQEGGHFKNNDRIIRLASEGKSVVEIAKELGMGLGEVKLVLDLQNKKGNHET